VYTTLYLAPTFLLPVSMVAESMTIVQSANKLRDFTPGLVALDLSALLRYAYTRSLGELYSYIIGDTIDNGLQR